VNSSLEFVENIHHISLNRFSKPSLDNNVFDVFMSAGRHVFFSFRHHFIKERSHLGSFFSSSSSI